jgi:hypothetical protein
VIIETDAGQDLAGGCGCTSRATAGMNRRGRHPPTVRTSPTGVSISA